MNPPSFSLSLSLLLLDFTESSISEKSMFENRLMAPTCYVVHNLIRCDCDLPIHNFIACGVTPAVAWIHYRRVGPWGHFVHVWIHDAFDDRCPKVGKRRELVLDRHWVGVDGERPRGRGWRRKVRDGRVFGYLQIGACPSARSEMFQKNTLSPTGCAA